MVVPEIIDLTGVGSSVEGNSTPRRVASQENDENRPQHLVQPGSRHHSVIELIDSDPGEDTMSGNGDPKPVRAASPFWRTVVPPRMPSTSATAPVDPPSRSTLSPASRAHPRPSLSNHGSAGATYANGSLDPSSPGGAMRPRMDASAKPVPDGSAAARDADGDVIMATETVLPHSAAPLDSAVAAAIQQDVTPPSSRLSKGPGSNQTPRSQTTLTSHATLLAETPRVDWDVGKIAETLRGYMDDVAADTATLVEYMLDEAERKAPERRHLNTQDFFADMKPIALTADSVEEETAQPLQIRFKAQHADQKPRKQGVKVKFPVLPIKTDKKAVPKYRFHHVEISKNVLAPNTMLNFVPHLQDVDSGSKEEAKYLKWLSELDNLDTQSGFKTMDRVEKAGRAKRDELAARLSLYLDEWISRLAIDGCTRSTLIRYMADEAEKDEAITPQQKSSILDTYSENGSVSSPQAARGAKIFTEAFNLAFGDEATAAIPVQLRDVLFFDKSVQTIVDNNRAKDAPSSQRPREDDWLPKLENALGSYAILGCWICFSHDCQHGEFDADNQRRTFSVESTGGVGELLKRKWANQLEARAKLNGHGISPRAELPCKNQCYRNYDVGNAAHPVEPWSEGEVQVLESIFIILGHSSVKAQCEVANLLGRKCWEVYKKMRELNLSLPTLDEPPAEAPKVKALSWYDRKKKALLGDWQEYTYTHEHALRRLVEPCHHDGPCTAANGCPCAENPQVLCERFCQCTDETCALKFTGCACHSLGKTCTVMRKEGKPCICVQLNRECDPVLCKGCGAAERADPENAHDEHLHSTGCQNVVLQRGASKAVIIGQSQLEGCGYGLFTAEDIAADEFVVEYTGELITHDEGVRREARRGDVFDEAANSSYLFTLLENEGIWVDAAIYGNLSRYINHDKIGANITPKILYVNGEYRIKFTALHNIKAGEELFFNYGDNFPNLTKKLLEDGKGAGAANGEAPRKRKGGRPPKNEAKAAKLKGKDANYPPLKKANGGRGKARKIAPNPSRSGTDDDGSESGLGVHMAGDDDKDRAWPAPGGKRRRAVPTAAGVKVPKKRGGARVGAGRKKKQPPPPTSPIPLKSPAVAVWNEHEEEGDATEDAFEPDAAVHSPAGSTTSFDFGADDSPSGRRSSKRIAVHKSLLPGSARVSFSGPVEPSAAPEEIPEIPKPKSNRGGARPGAGRKPKRQRNLGSATKKSDQAAGDEPGATAPLAQDLSDEDSEFTPTRQGPSMPASPINETWPDVATTPTATPSRRLGLGRKRKADEIEDSENEDDEISRLEVQNPFSTASFAPARKGEADLLPFPGRGTSAEQHDRHSSRRPESRDSRASGDGLGATPEGGWSHAGSSRPRKKPARYRQED